MEKIVVIGLGGFLGANARYFLSLWVTQSLGASAGARLAYSIVPALRDLPQATSFPYATMLINVSGSFVIGLFLTLVAQSAGDTQNLRLFFAVGFLGAYTTFSTFSFETFALIQSEAYLAAFMNVLVSLLLGLIGTALGIFIGKLLA